MPNTEFGRIPVTLIEIDQDRCRLKHADTNEFGTCNADPDDPPCFNTFATCQSVPDYSLGDPLTLRFVAAQSDLQETYSEYMIPSLQGVGTSPTKINVGARGAETKPLGRRAEVTASLQDHPHSDVLVDPYLKERPYSPLERGTFWGKWLRRNPYYVNRPMRLREGYLGQALEEMQTRHYVLKRITGPDSRGQVTVKAQDVLALADNDKAQAPRQSTGSLLVDITETDTSFTVTGGTASQYNNEAGNAIRVNDEVMRYTGITTLSNGDLSFTGVTRGSDNTQPDNQEAGDTVQACLDYVQQDPQAVAENLLVEYGEVNPALIPIADWGAEAETWLDTFTVTRLITEPTGVNELLGQLSEQCTFYLWWDDLRQEIRLRAIRPVIGEVKQISDDRSLLQNSVTLSKKPELRASEIWTSYLPRNPTEVTDDRQDYRRTSVRVDPQLAGPNAYNERRVYPIFSAWLETEGQVSALSFKLLSRYKEDPEYVNFQLDAKDRDLELGDVFDLRYRGLVDEFGEQTPVRYQVISMHENEHGSVIQYEAQKFIFSVGQQFGQWMLDSTPAYSDASENERGTGCFWGNEDGAMPGDPDIQYLWS